MRLSTRILGLTHAIREQFVGTKMPTVRNRFTPMVDRLEERETPATLYVDDFFRITADTAPRGLSNGDTVIWDYGQYDQVSNLTFGTNAFRTVGDAVAAAGSGDTVMVAAGNYRETGQIVIQSGESITIIGAGTTRTRLNAGFNSGDENSGDNRSWFLVSGGATLNLGQMTLNAISRQMAEGVRFTTGAAGGTIDHVAFQNIKLPPAAFDGIGVDVKSGDVDVLNCTFNNMGRMGVQYLNAGTTGQFSGNAYTGKGLGNWLDYAIEVGDGANVLISGNTINNCRGLTRDGFESGGILVDTLFAPGTVATILSNQIISNRNGIFVGVTDGDTDSSQVDAEFNNITGNITGMFVSSNSATVNAHNNWWGSTRGPRAISNPGGNGDPAGNLVNFQPFLLHVAAVLPVTSIPEYLSLTSNFLVVGGGGNTGNPTTKVVNVDGSVRVYVERVPRFRRTIYELPRQRGDRRRHRRWHPRRGCRAWPRGAPWVRVVDGVTGAIARRFLAPGFASGASVAIGDVNGDGVGDVILGAGPGGNPLVSVFSGKTGGLLRGFRAFSSIQLRGGVNVAAGDFNGDGFDDIVVGQGIGNFADVRVVSGRSPNIELLSFRAYSNSYLGGVNVAVGDVNGDGTPDIITAGAKGPTQLVQAFDGTNVATPMFAFDPGYTPGFLGGIRVAAGDLNGDGIADIVTAPGAGELPAVRIFDGTDQSEIINFLAFPAGSLGGVSVGVV